jgi:hypothetical protein
LETVAANHRDDGKAPARHERGAVKSRCPDVLHLPCASPIEFRKASTSHKPHPSQPAPSFSSSLFHEASPLCAQPVNETSSQQQPYSAKHQPPRQQHHHNQSTITMKAAIILAGAALAAAQLSSLPQCGVCDGCQFIMALTIADCFRSKHVSTT